jgi:hypothetical protein
MSTGLKTAARTWDSYLSEKCVHEQIQETAKEFVTHEYGTVQVSQRHGGCPFLCVREMSSRSEGNSSRIQGDHKGEKFSSEQDRKGSQKMWPRREVSDTHLYVLNHRVQRVHLRAFNFFLAGRLVVAPKPTGMASGIASGVVFAR